MIEIQLTRGQVAIIDDIDADLANMKWSAFFNPRCGPNGAFYASRSRLGLMHRRIMERIVNRKLERSELVDHRNLNSLDNRRENLRIATNTLNNANRRKAKHSGQPYKGIRLKETTQRWEARIWKDKKCYHLGYFDTPEEAHKAYCQKASELYGEFARFS